MEIPVKRSDKVAMLKVSIMEKTGHPDNTLRLYFDGRLLEDDNTISKAGLADGSLIRPAGLFN